MYIYPQKGVFPRRIKHLVIHRTRYYDVW